MQCNGFEDVRCLKLCDRQFTAQRIEIDMVSDLASQAARSLISLARFSRAINERPVASL